MNELFAHADAGGDEFWIDPSPRMGELALYWSGDNPTLYVNLPRNRVRDLRDALNRWLDEQQRNDPNPAGAGALAQPAWVEPNPRGPYHALVRRLVTEEVAKEVARVLPLHLSPQAAIQADPEPQDVGHSEEPADSSRAARTARLNAQTYCDRCGHSWRVHSRTGNGHCVAQLGTVYCGCERMAP